MEIAKAGGGFETRAFIANPNQQWGSTAPMPNGSIGLNVAGVTVTSETALQLAAVYGSSALISDSIATLPINQWQVQKSGNPKAIECSDVINQPWAPWPEFSMMDFITQGSMSYLLQGNIFGQILSYDDLMKPAQVALVNPDKVIVSRNRTTGVIEVKYGGKLQNQSSVTRSMGRSLPGAVVGMSPVAYMRQVLGLGLAYDKMSGAYFANGARPDAVIEVPGDVDQNEVEAFKSSWLEGHQGINHAYTTAILSGGATYKPISVSMQDAQFLQQMQYSASVISGMIYRVPPHMIGQVDSTTSWGSGIEQQEMGFVRNTLLFWLTRWEDWLTSWLPTGQFVTFDLSKRLRGDTLQRWTAYQMARVMGAMNNAEVREQEGLPLITDPAAAEILNDYAAPLNSAPIKPPSSEGVGGGEK